MYDNTQLANVVIGVYIGAAAMWLWQLYTSDRDYDRGRLFDGYPAIAGRGSARPSPGGAFHARSERASREAGQADHDHQHGQGRRLHRRTRPRRAPASVSAMPGAIASSAYNVYS